MNVEAPPRKDTGPSAPIGNDPRPVVALPNAGLPGIAIAVIAAVCAVLLFLVLDGQRRRAATDSAEATQMQTGTFAAPPPLAIPPEPTLAPLPPVVTIPVVIEPAPAPPPQFARPPPMIMPIAPSPMVSQAPVRPQQGLGDPALIFDAGSAAGGQVTAATPPQARPGGPGGPQQQQQQQQQRAGSRLQAPARPTRIANQGTVVPTGTLIRAVLETPIDTARPGLARAIVSKDTRGFDGQRVLIPRGSRLIGEYESDVRTGQNRVLVNWNQLIRPDGMAIRLDSPAADSMGGAGVPGRVNTFFFQRFFNAIFQTALTLGPSLILSNDADVVVGYPTAAITNVAGQGSLVGQAPMPKITVKQGTAFNVFVARDLDFSGAPLRK